ncbi:lactate utilization protein [Selenomonas sp. TAMA-11512]|uniref:LUD domain-containing protein n=1 Tax=Selenomonas sp. TAMA-11512 TaxID=3095337 RepID=UPI0030912207|nr:lactate utilization protein [Selenomonas sp. TAMA-11512]
MTSYEERIVRTLEAFRRNRYDVSRFADRTAAADYLAAEIRGKRVGFGDSETLRALSLYEHLIEHNEVIDPPRAGHAGGIEAFLAAGREALMTDVFLLSANAVTEQGHILNMDGAGNRVAGSLFGHEKTYFVVGINKLVPDIEAGIERIHRIAAPKNAQRKGKKTPCARDGERCYDCSALERICNALTIHYKKMSYRPMELVLIEEDLGL